MKYSYKILLVIILLLGYLGYRYPLQFDLTNNKMNSLRASTLELLSTIKKPLYLELFTTDRNANDQILPLIQLFQKENKNIFFKVGFNTIDPEKKSTLALNTSHNILLTYEGRQKALDLNPHTFNEEKLANLLWQIIREKEQWVVFLSGHGELDPFGKENRNLNLLTTELKEKGMPVIVLNLNEVGIIPDNTQILVIADPKTAWLPEETTKILEYVAKGGNLLWMMDPNKQARSYQLEEVLGIKFLHKTILDPKAHAMGTPNPAISVITQYPDHPITATLDKLTVFPWATPLQYLHATELGWEVKPLLTTNASTTLEKSNPNLRGSFTIGIALTKGKQRIIAVGNSHFLSNGSIHNYGNRDLAHQIFTWLNEAAMPPLFTSATKRAIEEDFSESQLTMIMRRYIFPYVLTLCYLGIGWQIRQKRQSR